MKASMPDLRINSYLDGVVTISGLGISLQKCAMRDGWVESSLSKLCYIIKRSTLNIISINNDVTRPGLRA